VALTAKEKETWGIEGLQEEHSVILRPVGYMNRRHLPDALLGRTPSFPFLDESLQDQSSVPDDLPGPRLRNKTTIAMVGKSTPNRVSDLVSRLYPCPTLSGLA
jgi:hypothetical protein